MKKTTKKILFVFVSIVTIVAVIMIIIFLKNKTNLSISNDYKLYKNEKYSYQVEIPKNWSIDESNNNINSSKPYAQVVFEETPCKNCVTSKDASISIQIEPNLQKLSLKEIFNNYIESENFRYGKKSADNLKNNSRPFKDHVVGIKFVDTNTNRVAIFIMKNYKVEIMVSYPFEQSDKCSNRDDFLKHKPCYIDDILEQLIKTFDKL